MKFNKAHLKKNIKIRIWSKCLLQNINLTKAWQCILYNGSQGFYNDGDQNVYRKTCG